MKDAHTARLLRVDANQVQQLPQTLQHVVQIEFHVATTHEHIEKFNP